MGESRCPLLFHPWRVPLVILRGSSPQTHLGTQVHSCCTGSQTEPSCRPANSSDRSPSSRGAGTPEMAPGHMQVPSGHPHTHSETWGHRMPTAALALPKEAMRADRANRPQHDLLHLCWHKGSFPWFQTQGWVPAPCPGPPEIKGSEIPESGHARLRNTWGQHCCVELGPGPCGREAESASVQWWLQRTCPHSRCLCARVLLPRTSRLEPSPPPTCRQKHR